MGAKQSKRSVDISGKEAESAGEVAAAGAGGEGRVEQLADVDALKPQVNGDALIQTPQEQTDKEKQLDSGTPENEKDATTEKEKKETENGQEKETVPVTNGESEPKTENGESIPAQEDGKKPKKEKVKKKWSLRSISFSRKDKPKQEKKQKEEEAKTNGEPEKVPEEAAEATPETIEVKVTEEIKEQTENKDEKTPETPVTEPITNGSSTPESPKVETPVVDVQFLTSDVQESDRSGEKTETEPEKLPINGLSSEHAKKETLDLVQEEDSKAEEPVIEPTETIPVPEIPVKTEESNEEKVDIPSKTEKKEVVEVNTVTDFTNIDTKQESTELHIKSKLEVDDVNNANEPESYKENISTYSVAEATKILPPLPKSVELVTNATEDNSQDKPIIDEIVKSTGNLESENNFEETVINKNHINITESETYRVPVMDLTGSDDEVIVPSSTIQNVVPKEVTSSIHETNSNDVTYTRLDNSEVENLHILNSNQIENGDEILINKDMHDNILETTELNGNIDNKVTVVENKTLIAENVDMSKCIRDSDKINLEFEKVMSPEDSPPPSLSEPNEAPECTASNDASETFPPPPSELCLSESEATSPASPELVADSGDASNAMPQDPIPVVDKLANLIPEVPVVPELKIDTLQETTGDVAVVN